MSAGGLILCHVEDMSMLYMLQCDVMLFIPYNISTVPVTVVPNLLLMVQCFTMLQIPLQIFVGDFTLTSLTLFLYMLYDETRK